MGISISPQSSQSAELGRLPARTPGSCRGCRPLGPRCSFGSWYRAPSRRTLRSGRLRPSGVGSAWAVAGGIHIAWASCRGDVMRTLPAREHSRRLSALAVGVRAGARTCPSRVRFMSFGSIGAQAPVEAPRRRSSRRACSSAIASRSFGRPAARLSWMSFSRVTNRQRTPKVSSSWLKGRSCS